MEAQLSEEAKKVLRAVADRAMDGYTLMRMTGLEQAQAEAALGTLLDNGLVRVEGALHGDEFGKAYLWVPPSVQGKVDYVLGKFAL